MVTAPFDVETRPSTSVALPSSAGVQARRRGWLWGARAPEIWRRNVRLEIFTHTFVAGVSLACLVASATAASASTPASPSGGCPLPVFGPGADYHPVIDPANFTPNVDNPLFPLTVGTTLVYAGTKDGQAALDTFAPSTRTRVIDGVTTRVVEDRLYLNGVLEEQTSDYYAQDSCGNVWYFGEDTAELDRSGHVISREGSFHAGVDGAEPGVFMQAQPELGRVFRQEWYQGHAEDVFAAIDLNAQVTVPYGSFTNALRTAETTALEPGVLDNKYYVPGIGEVEEVALRGPVEKLVLIEVR